VTRLVTVLVTLAVPEEADAEDAAASVADAAVCTALEVVSTAGVEGHLPVPGSVVQHRRGGQPWRVETVTAAGAVLCNLAADRPCAGPGRAHRLECWAGGLSGGGRRAAGQSVRDV